MKNKNQISAFEMAVVYVGTIIGAGFASGQEIFQFFVRFKMKGFWGLVITELLFIIFFYKIMELVYKYTLKYY